jgi:hypothetical protein
VKEGGVDRQTASYGGDGLRVSKWDYHTGQHDYSWGPGGVLHDTNQNTTHTPGWAQRRNGVDRGYLRDLQGSLRYGTDTANGAEIDVYQYDALGTIRSSSTDEIACWFIDTEYNEESFFVRHATFTGADQRYEKRKRALRAEVDEAAWAQM